MKYNRTVKYKIKAVLNANNYKTHFAAYSDNSANNGKVLNYQ